MTAAATPPPPPTLAPPPMRETFNLFRCSYCLSVLGRFAHHLRQNAIAASRKRNKTERNRWHTLTHTHSHTHTHTPTHPHTLTHTHTHTHLKIDFELAKDELFCIINNLLCVREPTPANPQVKTKQKKENGGTANSFFFPVSLSRPPPSSSDHLRKF